MPKLEARKYVNNNMMRNSGVFSCNKNIMIPETVYFIQWVLKYENTLKRINIKFEFERCAFCKI